MANQEHLDILKKGVEEWNKWRENNSDIAPDLFGANLREEGLFEANFDGAYLSKADLTEANLNGLFSF
jgi:uncharacterized protein YjbI with pentapeptide repeats